MSGSTSPVVGTIAMLDRREGRFHVSQLVVWTGHGWLPIHGIRARNVQVRMDRDGWDIMGRQHPFSRQEVELSATLDYVPVPLPEDAPLFDHTRVASMVFVDLETTGTLTGRFAGTDTVPANPPRVVGVDFAGGEPRIHPLDDLPAPPRQPPVGSRAEAEALHRERDRDPARPRSRRLRFLDAD